MVLSGFPRRSETFALADLAALERKGLLAAIFATKLGEPGTSQPEARRLASRVQVLTGDPTAQAREAAARLDAVDVRGVHAYFAHTPAEIGRLLADRLDVPFGFSVHARDARKVTRPELHRRAGRARCVIACNGDVAQELSGADAHVHLIPHGVDLDRFTRGAARREAALRLLAVGRLIEKKGFDVLLDAVAALTMPWHLRIVGEGNERDRLIAQRDALGLSDRVSLQGATTHDRLPDDYRQADIVIVPSVQDRLGDRDGLPNVVLEAMASGCAVVASDVGAIASAIRHGRTGLLVPPRDRGALVLAIETLGRDPAWRVTLGRSARRFAEEHYDVRACTERLASVLEAAYA
jgi:glycosyltransferase involved in cell wall biosynthesis